MEIEANGGSDILGFFKTPRRRGIDIHANMAFLIAVQVIFFHAGSFISLSD